MTLYDQTQLHSKEIPGNCWATCLAILLDLDSIPTLDILADDWWEQSESIANSRNKTLVEFKWESCRIPNGLFCIASGISPRKNWNNEIIHHCVIATLNWIPNGYKVEIFHDPHPERKGLATFEYITLAIAK